MTFFQPLDLNNKKAQIFRFELFKIWSGKRDSNSRPRPWQGRALPTELFPLISICCMDAYYTLKIHAVKPFLQNFCNYLSKTEILCQLTDL